jgi:hypothetical protein
MREPELLTKLTGRKALNEIMEVLAMMGLSLGMNRDVKMEEEISAAYEEAERALDLMRTDDEDPNSTAPLIRAAAGITHNECNGSVQPSPSSLSDCLRYTIRLMIQTPAAIDQARRRSPPVHNAASIRM